MTPTERRISMGIKLDPEEYDFVRAYAYHHNISKSAAIRRIISSTKARTPKSKGGDK